MRLNKTLKQGEMAMTIEINKRNLPIEGLDPYISLVAKTENLYIIQKIREVCVPLIQELTQNHLKELKACTGIFDYEVQIMTNANRATEKLIEEKAEEFDKFWEANRQELEKTSFSEEDFWSCLEWVPTKYI